MPDAETLEARVRGARVVADVAGEGPEAVLCVHGLASRRTALGPLVEVLAGEGFLALAPDLRGHGESGGPRGLLGRGRVLADLEAWRDRVEERGARVRAIVGHSLGGLWALLAQPRLGAEAIAAVASPASIRRELGAIERVGYRVGGLAQRLADPLGVTLRTPYPVGPEDTLDSREAIAEAREAELIQPTLPLANVETLLGLDAEELARGVTAASTVLHPRGDQLVSRASTRALYEALPEPKRWLETDGPHSCLFERGGRERARTVAEALRADLGNAGSPA